MIAVLITILLASCGIDRKEPIYEPGGEITQNPGRVRLERDPNGQVPDGQRFSIVNAQGKVITTLGYNDWVDLEAGQYYLLGYTGSEYFNLNGTTLSLKTTEGNPVLPEGLMGGASAFTVIEDQLTTIHPSFAPFTRKLRVEADLDGIDPQSITQMFSTLSGLAAGIDFSQGFGAVVKTAGNYTTQAEVKIVNGKLIADFNLLGIDTDADQVFNIELTTGNGKTYHLSMSLKQVLESFNSGNPAAAFTVNIQLSVDGEDTETSLSGTIIDWEDGEKVEIITSKNT